jgi:hypothetical protein
MKSLNELSVNDLKNAIWHMNDRRDTGMGICGVTRYDLRMELHRRTGELLGYHERPYANGDGECDCSLCERGIIRSEYFKAERRPRNKRYSIRRGTCPKLRENAEGKTADADGENEEEERCCL